MSSRSSVAQHKSTVSLARALINTSHLPLLLIDGDLRVLSASRSFCAAFEISQAEADGRLLTELGGGEWDMAQLKNLLDSALSDGLDAGPYDVDLVRPDQPSRRLVLNVQLVDYDENQDARILLAVEDVTEARDADTQIMALLMEKDELLRERAMLLTEMQHRIANSLQIIASVLQLKARATEFTETRRHLMDAHDRVMSVAAVQRHLELGVGMVDVAPYLTKLCESLESSMAGEGRSTVLAVRADAATVSSHEVVSLGLIVAELVINALKHGFPDGQSGFIVVDYAVREEGWTLSVTDDGVGRPESSPTRRVGLGTSVVASLARQLHGEVLVSDMQPGCRVAIVNTSPVIAPSVPAAVSGVLASLI
ncbi:MAG: histidine kinase [Phenylobacterium sp.]|nr:histidine kinase [Phenylobacterium sp.]